MSQDIKETIIKPSIQYRVADATLDFANHKLNGIVKRYMWKQMQPQKEPVAFNDRYKKRVHIVQEVYKGRPVYTLIPKGKIVPDREIVFIHGGGGVMPATMLHMDVAVSIVEKTGIPVNFLMYPLAPEANCALAFSWLVDWYEERRKHSPNKAFYVIGDSAGAGLSTALCHGGRAQVAGVVLISPAAGLDEKEKYMAPYEEHDILLSMDLMDTISHHWGKGMDITDWRINSAYVDYTGFPKTMIVYGGNEMFAGTIPLMVKKMQEAGVEISVYKGEIHCHDWALVRLLPEAKEVLKLICEFLS